MRKGYVIGLIAVLIIGITIGAVGCSELNNTTLSDSTVLTQGISSRSSSPSIKEISKQTQTKDLIDSSQTQQEIIQSFERDIGYWFKAWKVKDMEAIVNTVALGYTGNLASQKIEQAKPFITAGAGADVSNINYVSVTVTKIEGNSAEVKAVLNYSGYEYNVINQQRGSKFGPIALNNTYILQLEKGQWLIKSEQPTL